MDLSEPHPTPTTGADLPSAGPVSYSWRRVARYILTKTVTILITIFVGVFITVVLANRGGQIDISVENEVIDKMNELSPGWNWTYVSATPERKAAIDQLRWDLDEAAGLHLPYWPRHLLWTWKALRLDWRAKVRVTVPPGSAYHSLVASSIILTDLPHTLLLVGTAFLLLFLIGIPLALFLFRVQGSFLDRLMTVLAAATPIPSWVIGVLLVLVFSVTLRILPIGGMYDAMPAKDVWGRVIMVFRHMLLPVTAILLSLLLQCVYTWRTFFLLFSEEDYVELGRAKGLSNSQVEKDYILRPTLPYILTNFAILLVSFWQMTIALEKILNWPGIGRLYILTLPNFFGEKMYPGVMPITLGIVVLFAYILGITVFFLDITYALVDPRVRIGDEGQTLREVRRKGGRAWFHQRKEKRSRTEHVWVRQAARTAARPSAKVSLSSLMHSSKNHLRTLRAFFREIMRYPSAIVGFVIIFILSAGSLYAVIVYPYNKIGDAWYSRAMTGQISAPRVAQPAWTNWFRREPLPTMIIQDSQDGTASKTIQTVSNDMSSFTIDFTFQYPYEGYPQDLVVYFNSKYAAKHPFAMLTWITPDGREFEIGRTGVRSSPYYTIMDGSYIRNILSDFPHWRNWFDEYGEYPTPAVDLLFADPAKSTPAVLHGTYTLRVEGMTFEEASTLDAKMVLVGQVYGVAGTDYNRRDLVVPLLWGMPFALVFGLLGACVTTILSMALAATGVWYGGWVDKLIQGLVEANMILPIIGIAVLIYAYFNVSIWTILTIIVMLNVFGSPAKSFRAALMQVKDSPYIDAARAYSASDGRIIFRYLVPRIIPTLIPQLIILIPSYVFLEATLGIFNVQSIYPTWGRIIYEALQHGANYGSSFWVLEPIGLLLLTGLAFSMLGFALERILNPRIIKG
jgi:peptide/nickel transport system permease protein